MAFVAVSACERSGKEIVGEWSKYSSFEYGAEKIECLKDKTGYFQGRNTRTPITWAVLDEKRWRIIVQDTMLIATVIGDDLVLDSTGEQHSFVREGSVKAATVSASIQQALEEREIRIEAEKRALLEKRLAEERAERERAHAAERERQALMAQQQAAERKSEEEKLQKRIQNQEAGRLIDEGFDAWKRNMYRESERLNLRATNLEPESQLAARAWSNLGWIYATCPDPTLHDGPKAVECARRATSIDPNKGLNWNALAAAYARNGEFAEAVEAQLRAIALGSGLGGEEERLLLYRGKQAYQDTPQTGRR